MRFFFGLIVGLLIAIGGAYIHDATTASSMTGADASGNRMVNWQVVSRVFDRWASDAKNEWDKLTGQASRPAPRSRGT